MMSSVRETIIQEKIVNPRASTYHIAAKVGVSHQRVSKVLAEEKLPTRHWKQIYHCNQCGRRITTRQGKPLLFCNRECNKEYHRATLPCDNCGALFKIRYARLVQLIKKGQQHFFCSATCKGKFAGQHYGFHVHPKMVKGNIKSKWDRFILRLQKCSTRDYLSHKFQR